MGANPYDILIEAADHIERYGWVRRVAGNYGYPCCALGAICAVNRRDINRVTALAAIGLLEKHLTLRGFEGVASWNDEHALDKAEVVRTMREVAARAIV